ncbi:MAG: hypothetical protein F4039_06930 [Gammaproteobacteria bacterium]|nr:hypothetical protein [Gammaproteobacteria bacterium]MYF53738.1 hypothetical protein [Gammaproteobacteria bacterium]MYK43803.1 hypothetical protein [Gammaproteobacteria bacterium]
MWKHFHLTKNKTFARCRKCGLRVKSHRKRLVTT